MAVVRPTPTAETAPKREAEFDPKAKLESAPSPGMEDVPAFVGNSYFPRYGSLEARLYHIWRSIEDHLQRLNNKYALMAMRASSHLKQAILGVGHVARLPMNHLREMVDLPDIAEHGVASSADAVARQAIDSGKAVYNS